MNGHPSPPRSMLRFFRWFCHPKLHKYIEGDLMELYEDRCTTLGKRTADWKFIVDVLMLFRPAIIRPTNATENINQIGMYKSYFKIGWRNLLSNRGYSFINVGGLTFGITVTMLIGLWIYDELSFNKDNPNYDRIAQVIQNVTNNGEVETWKNVPFPLAEELRSNYGSDFKHIAMAVMWGDHMLTVDDKVLKQTGVYFEKGGPEILGLRMLRGSSNLNVPASILIS